MHPAAARWMKDVKRKMLRRAIPMGRRWRREVVMGVEGWRRENWRRARRGLRRRRRVWSFERVVVQGGWRRARNWMCY